MTFTWTAASLVHYIHTQTHTIWIFGISIHKFHYITTHLVWKFPNVLIQEYYLNRHTKIDNKSHHLHHCNTVKTIPVCEILQRPCYTTHCFCSTFPQLTAYSKYCITVSKTDVGMNINLTVHCKNNHILQPPASIYISFMLLSKKMCVKI